MMLLKLILILLLSEHPSDNWCVGELLGHYVLIVDGDIEEIPKVEAFILTEIQDRLIYDEADKARLDQLKMHI